MLLIDEKNIVFQNGDAGPKYLFREPTVEWGILKLNPGQDTHQFMGQHHHHPEAAETFFVLEGKVKVEVNGQAINLTPGQALKVEGEEKHKVFCDGDIPCRMLFIKTINLDIGGGKNENSSCRKTG